jgi:hypothetical protein
MTSIKKPLIAIASALALVATMVVAAPASAATVAISGGNYASPATDGTTAAKAVTLPVPADNTVDAADVLTVAVTSAASNSNVVFTATNAKIVTALHTSSDPVTSASGSSTVTIPTGTGTTATVYVFTTTTEAGTVVVSSGGNVNTYHIKGSAGTAYNLSAFVSAVANLNSDVDFTAKATDVFGNSVENAVITATVLRGTVKTQPAWNSTTKVYEGVITVPATAGNVSGLLKISASAVSGLPKPVSEVMFNLSVADLADQVKILSAKISEMRLKSESVTKKKYNKLARKWNSANPTKKVKLKK